MTDKPRILLVEDERLVAADIEECLKSLGYEVVGAAASGMEELRLAVRTEPDLVLLDIKLKGDMDGIDVASALYEYLTVPVVYLTAHADAEILERAKKTAPSGYILKPFDDRTLRSGIEIALEQHRRECRLIERARRLAAAVGSIDEAVIVTQEAGRIVVMNGVAENLTGWRQCDALGVPVSDVFTLLSAQTGSLQPSLVGQVMREGISTGLGDHAVLLSKDGVRRSVQGSVSPVWDGGAAVGVCLLFRAAARRGRDENWGSPEHLYSSRLEIVGRLTAAVAQQFVSQLESGAGSAQAAHLAGRLLSFAECRPAPSTSLDLNGLIAGLEGLLRCALGSEIHLTMSLGPAVGLVKTDPSKIELLFMSLAIAARDQASCRELSIETSETISPISGERWAKVVVSQPVTDRNLATDYPLLDEILRRDDQELRVFFEDGKVYMLIPKASQL